MMNGHVESLSSSLPFQLKICCVFIASVKIELLLTFTHKCSPFLKRTNPFEKREPSLLCPWMPAQPWRVSCCFHIVPLGLPAAVAHMGKQTRRWDKPITPQSEWTPAAAACSSSGLRALWGSIPMRASWISQRWELCDWKAHSETIFCLEIWHGGLLGQYCRRQRHTVRLQDIWAILHLNETFVELCFRNIDTPPGKAKQHSYFHD